MGPSGIGFVALDWQGNILAFGAKRIDNGTNNVAEAMAAFMAIRFAKFLSFSKLQVEGASLIIINAIIVGECHA